MLMIISFLRASMDFLKNIWRAKDEMQVCERKILLNKVLNVHNAFSLKRFGAPFSHLCARGGWGAQTILGQLFLPQLTKR
jgi:hypothetical protein